MGAATKASRYLCAVARRAVDAYLVHTAPRAILLTGSAAQGDSDFYSDVDLLAYYDRVPSHEAVGAAREAIGGAVFGPRSRGRSGASRSGTPSTGSRCRWATARSRSGSNAWRRC
jgi:hypothetical protein